MFADTAKYTCLEKSESEKGFLEKWKLKQKLSDRKQARDIETPPHQI